MQCLACGGRLLVWQKPGSDHDYYCPGRHGPFGEGLFYREEWDGERYVLVHSKPGVEVIEQWRKDGVLVEPKPVPSATDSSKTANASSSAGGAGIVRTRGKTSSSTRSAMRGRRTTRTRRAALTASR